MSNSTRSLIPCAICDVKFKPLHSLQIYCSPICAKKGAKLKEKKISIVCKTCGNAFSAVPGTLYCSEDCRWHKGEAFCATCGNVFTKHNERHRYCSSKCRVVPITVVGFTIFERDDFRCVYCGRSSIEDGVKLHVDHIFPESKGGQSVAENLITACESCNASKSARVLDLDIRSRLSSLTRERNQVRGIQQSQAIHIP